MERELIIYTNKENMKKFQKALDEEVDRIFPTCNKCGNKIKRKKPQPCPTTGLIYCEKCIDPNNKIYK